MQANYKRYIRQIKIHDFGTLGQRKLGNKSIFIAGAGGLGSYAAMSLAAAGIGKIGIADCDSIELSNLNRQIFYNTLDINRMKIDVIRRRINKFNPDVEIVSIKAAIKAENANGLITDYDLIIDALDNFSARYVLNRISISKGIPLIHGAVNGFEGRVTTLIPGLTPCLKCIYPKQKKNKASPVIGASAAIVGNLQATEAIKYLLGIGSLLKNCLLIFDGLSMEFMRLNIKRKFDCGECRLGDIENERKN